MTSQLDLPIAPDDYREDWEPTRYSCWDCAHIRRPLGGFRDEDWCLYHQHPVSRVAGMCSEFREVENAYSPK